MSSAAELILQHFHHFTYVTAHSPTLPSLYLRHSSFSIPSVASPTSQLILQPFRRFTYVTTHSPTLPLLYLRHNSFSNPSVASPTSQLILILQAFCHFTYVTDHSPTLPSLYLRYNSFSNPSVASPTSQLILQPLFRFSCVTGSSLTSPGEPPMDQNIYDPTESYFYVGLLTSCYTCYYADPGSYLTFMPSWVIKKCRPLPTKLQIYENLFEKKTSI